MRFARLAVIALSATAPVWSADGPATPPTVAVFLEFDSHPGAAPIRVMEQEVEDLLRPTGIALDWRSLKENRGVDPADGLIILKFKGKCRVERLVAIDIEPGFFGERTLASTALEEGRVLPFSQVRCDEVRNALAYLRPWADRRERQVALGLALGRVVAHELYHILARTTAHAAHGLAQASHSLKDLVSMSRISFGEEDLRAIREGVAATIRVLGDADRER